jgi:hypothetical protein
MWAIDRPHESGLVLPSVGEHMGPGTHNHALDKGLHGGRERHGGQEPSARLSQPLLAAEIATCQHQSAQAQHRRLVGDLAQLIQSAG